MKNLKTALTVWYVYVHYWGDKPIYVGKGTGRRAFSLEDRSEEYKNWMISGDCKPAIQIVAWFETEQESHDWEAILINEWNMVEEAFNKVAGHHTYEAYERIAAQYNLVGTKWVRDAHAGDVETPSIVVNTIYNYAKTLPRINTFANPCAGTGTLSFPDIGKERIAIEKNKNHWISLAENSVKVRPVLSDYLTLELNMKQDLIIINPPFSIETEKRAMTVWKDFIKKAVQHLSDEGVIIAVIPQGKRTLKTPWKEVLLKDVKFQGISITGMVVVIDKIGIPKSVMNAPRKPKKDDVPTLEFLKYGFKLQNVNVPAKNREAFINDPRLNQTALYGENAVMYKAYIANQWNQSCGNIKVITATKEKLEQLLSILNAMPKSWGKFTNKTFLDILQANFPKL